MDRRSYTRKHLIYLGVSPVPENPEFDREGMKTLAGALCCLAASAHSKDAGEQEQMAATFFNCAMTGFEGVRADEAVTAFVKSMLDNAKRR